MSCVGPEKDDAGHHARRRGKAAVALSVRPFPKNDPINSLLARDGPGWRTPSLPCGWKAGPAGGVPFPFAPRSTQATLLTLALDRQRLPLRLDVCLLLAAVGSGHRHPLGMHVGSREQISAHSFGFTHPVCASGGWTASHRRSPLRLFRIWRECVDFRGGIAARRRLG